MKTAHEIFLTTGMPLPKAVGKRFEGLHRDYRAFNEHDIEKIQREALKHALEIVDRYQSSMGTRDGMIVANSIWKEINALKELSK